MQAYCIDLNHSQAILDFSGEELQADLDYMGTDDPCKLSDPDRKVFLTVEDCQAYLDRYNRVLNSLDLSAMKRTHNYPCLLYPRRYIVQALMREKNETRRRYCRAWNAGQMIYLYDQTIFLAVRLLGIDKIDNCYRYRYELP